MTTLSKQLLAHANSLPAGSPLVAKTLLHLGERAALDQALARLGKRGQLLRVGRGVYVLPVPSRFGAHAPSASQMAAGIMAQHGETVVVHGAVAANALGVTTQMPMRTVYLTSGASRRLQLGAQSVELRHAPAWQLVLPGRCAGDVVRTLAWLGPAQASSAIAQLRSKLQPDDMQDISAVRAQLPAWMAAQVSAVMTA